MKASLADPERERAIFYGLDDDGTREIVDRWWASAAHTGESPITPEEFDRLWDSGIIDELNDHYDVIIDDYEIDAIGGDLSYAMKCVEPHADDLPNVYAAFKEAYERGTALLFCF